MLGQRRRRWANIKTSLFQRVVFVGNAHNMTVRSAVSRFLDPHSNSTCVVCISTQLNHFNWGTGMVASSSTFHPTWGGSLGICSVCCMLYGCTMVPPLNNGVNAAPASVMLAMVALALSPPVTSILETHSPTLYRRSRVYSRPAGPVVMKIQEYWSMKWGIYLQPHTNQTVMPAYLK